MISYIMQGLLLAIQFLTIAPIKIRDFNEKKLPQAVIFFPIVGLLLGLFLSGLNNLLLTLHFEQFISSTILVILLIISTGGLHLDGLADTFDAIAGGKNKEEILQIMRDPHIGTIGVTSIFCAVSLKIALLSSINHSLKLNALILMCVISRWSLVLTMFSFPYAREEGKAKAFIQGMNINLFCLTTTITLLISAIIWQFKGLLIIALSGVIALMIGKYISSKIGGITGDVLGAVNELIEISVLFCVHLYSE